VDDPHSCEALFDALSLVADGETAEAKCRAVLEHVGDCEPCRRYLDSLKATRAALVAQGASPALDAAEVARLLEACRQSLRERRPDLFAGTSTR